MKNTYKILVGKPEGKIALGRRGNRWDVDLAERRYEDDWNHVAQNRVQWHLRQMKWPEP
jgi:hypothetical protein